MSDLFVFRRYKKRQGGKKARHPKLIVDETGGEYGFMGLTSSKDKGRRHKNIPLIDNPQFVNGKRLKTKSYLRRKIEYDEKRRFGEALKDYRLSDEDRTFLIGYVKKRKKKR